MEMFWNMVAALFLLTFFLGFNSILSQAEEIEIEINAAKELEEDLDPLEVG